MSSSSPQEEVQGMALPAGMPLGSYRLLRVLGQGGFGITYLAEQTGSGQQVVIKENLPAAFAYRVSGSHRVYASGGAVQKDFDWALTRFVDEARILAALQHPGVVRVLECFEALGTAYYVMPWVGGEVLSKAAPAPAEITESWLLPQLRRLLVTLEYLHGRNVLHRDIKPANVLLQANGEPILIDFGAARIMVSERSATHIESEGYTPIEQLQSGSKHGPWTDLYALGATCYRLITGERPPRSVNRIGKRDCYQPLAARKELTQRFSPAFLKGIDKALAIWPEDRWQSAAEWLRNLPAEKVKKEAPTEPSPSAQAPVKGSARLPWVLVLLLLAAGGVGILYHLNTAAEWEQKLQEVAPLVEIGQKVKEEEARKAREEEERRVREATREGARARLRELGVSSPDGGDLCSAVEDGDIEKVRLMLAAGINPNYADEYGLTPLFRAAGGGRAEVVKLMLAAPGIDVNKVDTNGWTPLYYAAREGHSEVVKLLLAAPGIDVNEANTCDWTPLYQAARKGRAEVVKLLLAAPGIDVNKANDVGWTPLHTAAWKGAAEVVKLLLAAPGIDVNKADGYGWTPLFYAASGGHAEVVKLLLAAPGIDVNKACTLGLTPLYWAANNGHAEVVKLLLAAPGIDVNTADEYGQTPLYKAAKEGHAEVVKLLLAAPGIDVNKADADGCTPLKRALISNNTECAELIRAAGGHE